MLLLNFLNTFTWLHIWSVTWSWLRWLIVSLYAWLSFVSKVTYSIGCCCLQQHLILQKNKNGSFFCRNLVDIIYNDLINPRKTRRNPKVLNFTLNKSNSCCWRFHGSESKFTSRFGNLVIISNTLRQWNVNAIWLVDGLESWLQYNYPLFARFSVFVCLVWFVCLLVGWIYNTSVMKCVCGCVSDSFESISTHQIVGFILFYVCICW